MGSVRVERGVAAVLALGLGIAFAGRAEAADVLVDFGATGTTTATDSLARTWNNVTDANDVSGSPFTLNGTGGTDTGYRLSISNPVGVTNAAGFNGANSNGTTSPSGAAQSRGYPTTATGDSLYGNTIAFNGATVEAVRLTLSGLSQSEQYDLRFFASRTGVTDNRETEYKVTGAGSPASVFLNVTENTSNVAALTGVHPDTANQIVIDIAPGPNNNNANRFFYLGVLEINSSVPEPSGLGLAGLAALGLLRRRRTAV